MPPGARAKVHYHERIETIAYMLDGQCVVRFGDRMQHEVLVRQGDHAFVPADLPHAPCTWLVVQSSGSDQEGIVLLPGSMRCSRRDGERTRARPILKQF